MTTMTTDCECGSVNLARGDGAVVCRDCGLVLDESLPVVDARYYRYPDEASERPNEVLSELGGTTLGTRFEGVKTGSGIDWSRLARVNKMHTSLQRTLVGGYAEIERLVSAIQAPRSVAAAARVLFKRCAAAKLIRGRSTVAIVGACLYIACRTTGVPVTLATISEHSEADRRDLTGGIKVVTTTFNIRVPRASVESFVPLFASILGCGDKYNASAVRLLRLAKSDGMIQQRLLTAYAGAALYIVLRRAGVDIHQKEFVKCGFCEATLRTMRDHILSSQNAAAYAKFT